MADYTYVLGDFVGLTEPEPNLAVLDDEVLAAGLSNLTAVNKRSAKPPTYPVDNWIFTFSVALSPGEETTLDGVVAAHTGEESVTPTDVVLSVRAAGLPTVNSDVRRGFVTGSLWTDTTQSPEEIYVCLDPASGAASWAEVLSGGLADVFRAQQIETDNLDSTSLTTPQNAFAGEPLEYITISADGDYLVFFESDTEMTNSNGIGEISVGKNGLTTLAGSERQLAGNQRRSTITIKRVNSLVIGDAIYALFRQVSGSGQMNIRGRSLSLFRIST